MGLANGLADAMISGRADSAESAARRAMVDARSAQEAAADWKKKSNWLEEVLAARTTQTLAGMVVINEMIQVMEETMSPVQRETFRSLVAQKTKASMIKVDQINKQKDPKSLSLLESFKEFPQNEILRVV